MKPSVHDMVGELLADRAPGSMRQSSVDHDNNRIVTDADEGLRLVIGDELEDGEVAGYTWTLYELDTEGVWCQCDTDGSDNPEDARAEITTFLRK